MDFAFIIPGASRSVIVGVLGDRLEVKVAAPPEDGKANQAVIELVSEWLGRDVEIVAGHRSAEKRVLVTGLMSMDEGRLAGLA